MLCLCSYPGLAMRGCVPKAHLSQMISLENLSQVPANKNKLRGYSTCLDHHNRHRNICKVMYYINEQGERHNGVILMSALKIKIFNYTQLQLTTGVISLVYYYKHD